MEVLLANEYGFCFGVERAVEMVENALEGGGPVRTLGSLIHNTQEMQRLECEGVSTVQDPAEVSKDEIAVIRALGFRQRQVLALVLSEAMVLALLGGLVGVLFSIPFTHMLVEGMKHSPVAPFAYNIHISAATLLTAFVAAVAIGIVSGFVPAIRSARVSIVDGLRQVA